MCCLRVHDEEPWCLCVYIAFINSVTPHLTLHLLVMSSDISMQAALFFLNGGANKIVFRLNSKMARMSVIEIF